MSESALTRSMVSNPQMWRLALRLSSRAVDVAVFSPVEDNSLIFRHIELDGAASSPLKALEDVVYSNDLLLADFAKVYCVIDSDEVILLPPGLEGNGDEAADARDDVFAVAFPDFRGETLINNIPGSDVTLMAGLPEEIPGFLRRTFFNPVIVHRLTPLCRYFVSAAGRNNQSRTYVNLRSGAADVIVVDNGRIQLANTYEWQSPEDVVYYVTACRRLLGIDVDSSEVMIAGDAELREVVTPMLRKFICNVMPVIFPSQMFKLGKDAMKAPFDLIILPLCE